MNTKTTKFLAVLAVLAMAFAAIAVVAPSGSSDATSTVTSDGTMTTTITPTGAANTTKNYYVDASAAAVTLTLTATSHGANAGEVYNLYVYGSTATNTLTLTGVSSLGANKTTINVYAATEAISGTTITYNADERLSFVTEASSTDTGSAIAVVGTEEIYMTAAPAEPFLTNYYQAAASKFVQATGEDITLGTNGYAFKHMAGAPAYTGVVGDGTTSVKMTKALATAGFTLTATTVGTTFTLDGVLTGTGADLAVTAGELAGTTGSFTAAAATHITGVSNIAPADDATPVIYPTLEKALAAAGTTANVIGNFSMTGNTKAEESFSVAANCTFTVPARYTLTVTNGATFTVAGNMTVYGKVVGTLDSDDTTYPTLTVTGNVYLKPASTLYGFVCSTTGKIGDISADDASVVADSYTVNEDTTVTNLVVEGTLTVAPGVTLTVNGALIVKDMAINGKLIVTNTGSIGKLAGTEDAAFVATIGSKGSIDNSGTIGKNFPITYQIGAKKVVTAGVSGISAKYSTNGPVVSGVAKAIDKAFSPATAATIAKPSVSVNAAVIGDLTIPAAVDIKMVTAQSIVSGALSIASSWTPEYGPLVVAGGSIKSTGTYLGTSANGAIGLAVADQKDVSTYAESGASIVTDKAISGFTVSVVKTTVVVDENTTYYNYRAYLSGTLAAAAAESKLTVTGAVWVADSLYAPANVQLVAGAGTSGYIVTGKINATVDLSDVVVNGATYSITTDEVPLFYAVSFADGIDAIEDADDKTVTIINNVAPLKYEKYTYAIDDDLIIAAGETLAYAGNYEAVYVPYGYYIAVQNTAALNGAMFVYIDGAVVVYNDGSCTPDDEDYDVMKTSEEYITYCGFQTALDLAVPGDTIVFSNAKTFANGKYLETLVVPTGVTLEISGTMDVLKTVTVSKDAVLEVTGALAVGSYTTDVDAVNGVRLNVIGTADLTGGSTVVTGKSAQYPANIYSTGTLKYTSSTFTYSTNAKLNGFGYLDTNYYLTDLASAVASKKAVTAYGEVVDAANVTLAANFTLADDADITVGTMDISGYTLTAAAGKFTGIIAGTDLEGEDAALAVADFTGTVSDLKSSDVYTMKVTAFDAGELGITAGSVYMADSEVVGDTLVVAAGATMYLNSASDEVDIQVVDQTYLGDIVLVKGSLTLTGTAATEAIIITGDVMISDVATFTIANNSIVGGNIMVYGKFVNSEKMLLVGTIAVDDSEDSVAEASSSDLIVMGIPTISAGQGTIDGLLTIANNTYIIAFPGAEISLETLAKLTKETDVIVNGETYCTLLANTAQSLDGIITALEIEIEGYNMSEQSEIENWTDISGDALSTEKIGDIEAAYFNGTLLTVTLKVSAVTGLSLYIDGVKMLSDTYNLSVGAHTVSATVNAGYACDNMKITFDGAPVTVSGLLLTVDDEGSVLAVSGDVYIPEPEPVTPEEKSEWTITTILLVILVILIAVMAVIVALRLNRS